MHLSLHSQPVFWPIIDNPRQARNSWCYRLRHLLDKRIGRSQSEENNPKHCGAGEPNPLSSRKARSTPFCNHANIKHVPRTYTIFVERSSPKAEFVEQCSNNQQFQIWKRFSLEGSRRPKKSTKKSTFGWQLVSNRRPSKFEVFCRFFGIPYRNVDCKAW